MKALTEYVAILAAATGRSLTLGDVHFGLARGLTVSLAAGEAAAALAYGEHHWNEWVLPV